MGPTGEILENSQMGMKRGWETQSFYQSKLLVASGIPGWNATNRLYRHQGEMLRFLCRLINLITPKKWELVESTDVKKTASNLHCSPVSPQAPWTLPRHLLCSLCIPSSFLWKSFCSPRTPWIWVEKKFNSKGAGGWTNICLHSPQWYVGRRFVKTNVGHFDDQTLQLRGWRQFE